MKIITKIMLVFICITLLYGCGTVYQSKRNELLRTAKVEDYGPSPPENHKAVEEKIILSLLKDPGSAQFQWGEVRRDIIPKAFASPTPKLIWISSVYVNAKNSFGGYTGFKPYEFAWSAGKLYAIALPGKVHSGGTVFLFWDYLQN